MVSKADQSQGERLNMKMFNLGYAVGIISILLVWNLIVGMMYENLMPFTKLCKRSAEEHISGTQKTDTPIFNYMAIFLTICIIYVLLISKRTYKYLDSLNDNDLQNLPAKNILTFRDTKVLVMMIYLGFIMYNTFVLLEYLNLISLKTMMDLHFLEKFIFGDLLFSFLYPIFIIRKTKKYLPELWSNSNEVQPMLPQNNDFFAWPPVENFPSTEREMCVRSGTNKETNTETLRRNLNENPAPQHPLAPEY